MLTRFLKGYLGIEGMLWTYAEVDISQNLVRVHILRHMARLKE